MSPNFLFKKIIFYFGSFWVILFINFIIPRLMPGNPVVAIISQIATYHPVTTGEVQGLYSVFGTPNEPLWFQFLQFTGNVFRGNFGTSISFFPESVLTVISGTISWTVLLFGLALVISFFIGNYLGAIAANSRTSTGDKAGSIVALFLYSFPYFWLALMLQVILALKFKIFPPLGPYNALKYLPSFSFGFISSVATHLALPLITLVVTSYGGWFLGMRNNMLTILNEDFMKYGKMIGMKNDILLRYARRNALIPNMTAFALALGGIIGGGILVDIVFSYPGLGFVLYDGILNEDYPLIQAVFLFIIIGVLLANFFMDILYVKLDPRIAEGE
jgi:peptide/nickel transport system permease protein